jgi:choline dehydrogenase-like flavoprotein
MERDLTPGVYMDWFSSGTGTLTSSGVHASGIISSSIAKANGEGDWPDIQLLVSGVSVSKTFAGEISKAFGLKIDEMTKYYEHAVNKDSFTMIISGARPLSRGYIKLGGTSPYDKPIIDPNYLNDENGMDIKVLLEGVKKALYMVENTTTFGIDLGARFTEEPLPGCEHHIFRSDEYWECYIRRYSVTLHHGKNDHRIR